ncbi:CoA-binding protein [Thermococcus aggregans]|uniref:acetate--CoA ligase (ADP-forming) n=1 Tax=Thermococcus aggregans TaxID=110163 RepID=A0A9E7MW83_THEAG|nr:CoA-binding protein [Thermococcus aggregans]USS40079.1 CoA-binding protein [Thermococcus aggregans]
MNEDIKQLERIFEPKSIAIIGASPRPGKIGNMVLKNIISGGYEGKIYPINPNYDEILGFKCYDSILDVPDTVDLAILAVPSSIVPKALEECGEHGVAGAVIFASGFSEYSEHGRQLEDELLRISKKHGIRVIGPNCMGFFNAEAKLNATFSPGITSDIIRKGYAAFISQSGALSTAVLLEAASQGVYFDKFFTLGNKIDIDESDILLYLNQKESIKLVAIYMEGLRENKGRAFLDTAKKVSKTKPIVVLKAGKTEAGSKAARSHTGSLSGVYAIYQAAFNQANVIEVNTLRELLSFAKLLSVKHPIKGEKIAIISGSGGAAVLATDGLESANIKITPLPEDIKSDLKELLSVPRYAAIDNPMDLTFEGATPENFEMAIKYIASKKVADIVLICLIGSRAVNVVETLIQLNEEVNMPLIACWTGKNRKEIIEAAELLNKNGIPVFDFPTEAGRYLGRYIQYLKRRE